MQQHTDNRSLVVIPNTESQPLYQLAAPMPQDSESDGPSVPISHYLWVFRRHRWKMLAFILTVLVATLVISSRLTPIYESTATVDVDRQTPQGVLGQEAVRGTVTDTDQFMATQVRLIQSDSVLRPVAEKFKLRERESDFSQLPNRAGVKPAQAPVVLKDLRVSRPTSTYLLSVNYRSRDPELAAKVANEVAASYLRHTYDIRIRASASLASFMEKQMDELRAKMERSSQALSKFERELNVINPEEKTNIVSSRLLQLITEYTNAQAERVKRESVFRSVQAGTLEAAQASQQGEDLRKISERLNEVMENFAQVRSHYAANHPEYRKVAAQVVQLQGALDNTRRNIAARVEVEYQQAMARESMLQKAVSETKTEFDQLNARSFEYQDLKREADSDKKLFDELVHRIKEAGINAGFQNNSVRLADPARPGISPVFPNIKLNMLVALLVAMLVAFGGAILSDTLDTTVRDPEQVARSLNTEVIGSLPSVKGWRGRLAPGIGLPTNALVKVSDASESAVHGFSEAIRSLRNSILLFDSDRRVRSILVTSAAPGEGKSTTAAHLASTHAEQGHRTLLIDGDLRKPSLHKRFGLSPTGGLVDALNGELAWRELVIQPAHLPDLHILPAGGSTRRASDLLARGLSEILAEAAGEYDLVVLDAPPLPGFSEPLQMSTIVDGVIIVARAGQTNRKAVAGVLATLRRMRANVLGVVLNEVHKEMSEGYSYYGYYSKYYQAQGRAS